MTCATQTVVQALQTIDRRVNELGVAEPNISRYGSAQRPDPRAAARRDRRRAREGDHPVNTALLELKIVEAGPASTKEALLQSYGGKVPDDMEIVSGARGGRATPARCSTWSARSRR